MDNQQQNCNLRYNGKVIKREHLQELYNKYINGSSLSELSNTYGYNIGTIRNFLKTNGVEIRNVKESVKKFHKQADLIIDNFLEENLIGWIMGDGGLRLQKHAINPYFTYTDKHEDHIKYIASILNKYSIKYGISINSRNGCFQLQSETRPEFHKYYDLFYGYEGLNERGQKRKILPDITLTPIILRNWYIGDGSSVKQTDCDAHKAFITCKYKNNYILKQLSEICEKEIKCYLDNSKEYASYKYYFGYNTLIKLLDYIGPCPVESYKYKWITRCSTTIIETSDENLKESDDGIV